jgi:hypothetical protein
MICLMSVQSIRQIETEQVRKKYIDHMTQKHLFMEKRKKVILVKTFLNR